MDNIPIEILDNVLGYLLVYHHPLSERFSKVTPASKMDILKARLVCRGFCESIFRLQSFTKILEETPLICRDQNLGRFQAVLKSRYASSMTTLSVYMFPIPSSDEFRSLRWELWELVHLQSYESIKQIKHLRLYSETHIAPDDHTSASLTPAEDIEVRKTLNFNNSLDAILKMNGIQTQLQSIAMPSYYGKDSELSAFNPDFSFGSWVCKEGGAMKSFSITKSYSGYEAILGRWCLWFENMSFLDISVKSDCDYDPFSMSGRPMRLVPTYATGKYAFTFPKLRTFRLTAEPSHPFSEVDIIKVVDVFPNLQSLGLAYITLRQGDWDSVLQQLQPFNLQSIQLLFPSH